MRRRYKHLRIEENTWNLLNEVGRKNETYDQIIKRVAKKAKLKI